MGVTDQSARPRLYCELSIEMKILHIITGLGDGGAEAVLYRLVTHQRGKSHHVVSMMGPGKYGPLLEAAGASVTALDMPRGKITFSGLLALWRLLRTSCPDVVQTWMYHADLVGGLIAKLSGVRKICWGIHHTNLERGKSSLTTIWIARINAFLSRLVPHAIVCCAEKAREVHVELGYDINKMVVIPNGYDLGKFCPDAVARKCLRDLWELDDEVFVLGMIGRFDPQKDHANLISALAHVKQQGFPFVCILVGSGMSHENTELVSLIKESEVSENVRLLGQRSDIPAVMNAIDLHVLSSSAEAFPNVLAEAMACGTPCVTTDVGDAATIVAGSGWVVSPKDCAALADAVSAAHSVWISEAEWLARKVSARKRIEDRFSIERMAAAYTAVWS